MENRNDGLLVIDKPAGVTSRAVVNRAQRWFPGCRIGHTGTLDPLATGVLVLCLGAATRLTEYVQRMIKTYRARVRLGARSDTDDADGVITPVADAVVPDRETIARCLAGFVGAILQVPPAYSAAKVTGRRAYRLARKGHTFDLQPRTVQVYGIDLLDWAFPRLDLEVRCGKGTYIRSLARDLGDRLGCGAYVESLRRTRVGPFTVDDALSPDTTAAEARSRLQPLALALAEIPRLEVTATEAGHLRQGRQVPWGDEAAGDGSERAVFDSHGSLVGIVRGEPATRSWKPDKILS
jgi:tRNA pseudouridine55 synthase